MRCLMFDTVLNKIIVFLSVFVLCIGLFIAFLFVPVFADSYSLFDYFYIFPNSSITYSDNGVNSITLTTNKTGYLLWLRASDSYNSVEFDVSFDGTSSNDNALLFRGTTGSTLSNLSGCSYYSGSQTDLTSSSLTGSFHFSLSDISSDVNLFGFSSGNGTRTFTISNLSIDGVIVDEPSFEPLYDGFNLPRGYLARITFRDSSVSNNNSITLTSTFGNKSNAITGRFTSSQWYRFINTDLASVVLQYENLGTKISWTPFGNHTTLGQYENGSFTLSGSSSTQLWVVNPVYQSYQINSLGVALAGHGLNGVLNNNVVINDPYGIIEQIRLFPLSSGLVVGVDGVVNDTNEDAYKDVNGSTSGAFTYTDSNGNITGSIPQNGATLVDDTTASSLDILNTIKNAFNDLINRLESIFHPAQGFFNTILGSFNSFVHWLSQLWSWLPSPIVSLIEAVLYISILVGCIKLVF